MINHARTLLLNQPGASRPGLDFYLEEYVDPAYKPVVLSSQLATISNLLLGGDDAFNNYRLAQLMKMLHSTEFAQYVYALDPRVTYLWNNSVVEMVYGLIPSPANTPAVSHALTMVGQPVPTEKRLSYSYTVAAISNSAVVVTDAVTNHFVETQLTFSDGLSSLANVPDQPGLQFYVAGNNDLAGCQWLIQGMKTPTSDITDLIPQLSAARSGVGILFDNTEPYKTFGQLWYKHCYLSYQLSGLVLAQVYRIEALRNHE